MNLISPEKALNKIYLIYFSLDFSARADIIYLNNITGAVSAALYSQSFPAYSFCPIEIKINYSVGDRGRMMKSCFGSIIRKLLTLLTVIFFAVTLLGCHDPVVSDMEAEHRRLGDMAQQEIRQSLAAFLPTSQSETFYPAP